jgi:hypothetical protein
MIYILTKDLKIILTDRSNLVLWEKATLEVHQDFSSASIARAWYRS